jgi:hypothetical protein
MISRMPNSPTRATRGARWASLVALAALAACGGPSIAVESAREVGTLGQSSRVVGRDGAYSAKAWGQNVWDFGDTFLSVSDAEGFNFVSNTLATSAPAIIDGGLVLLDRLDDAGAPSELLFPTPEELSYDDDHRMFPDGGCLVMPCGGRWATWPGSIAYDPESQTAIVFYGLLTAAPGDFNFTQVGQSLALWSDFAILPERPVPGVCPGQPMALFCNDEPEFGNAAAVVDGMVYAFGCQQSLIGYPCDLARAPVTQAARRTAWEFWDGNGFSPDVTDLQSLFDGASIMQVFWNDYADQWMVIYSSQLSNQVVYRTAPQLTGPWSPSGNLFVADQKGNGGYTYDALPHPELAEQGGKIQYVTFSRGTGGFSSEFALVRVEFE